jgi:hypothetical protein
MNCTFAFCQAHAHLPLHDCRLFGWLVAYGWCWFVLREEYCWLVADDWFVVREKYCWLVADKPSEHGVDLFPDEFFNMKGVFRY